MKRLALAAVALCAAAWIAGFVLGYVAVFAGAATSDNWSNAAGITLGLAFGLTFVSAGLVLAAWDVPL